MSGCRLKAYPPADPEWREFADKFAVETVCYGECEMKNVVKYDIYLLDILGICKLWKLSPIDFYLHRGREHLCMLCKEE